MVSITQANHNCATVGRWDHLDDSIGISSGTASSWEKLVSNPAWAGNSSLSWIMINLEDDIIIHNDKRLNKCLICNLISLRCYILAIKYGNAEWMNRQFD